MSKDDKECILNSAKKTFLALKNPYHSVDHVYANAIDGWSKLVIDPPIFVGVKNRFQVPEALIKKLAKHGNYRLHTLDHASPGGRAVDTTLLNPITGRCMSGSSSGTAVNVLLGMNDLGIGVDGGGSVLAPAMSTQLFGFISPLLEQSFMEQFQSQSTDDIAFSPSLGYMTREFDVIEKAIRDSLTIPEVQEQIKVYIPEKDFVFMNKNVSDIVYKLTFENTTFVPIVYPKINGERAPLLAFLSKELKQCDVMISYEGPVDYLGFGDSVIGHFDETTHTQQMNSGKGLIRVANMVNATAICIPSNEFACAYVLLCESKPEKIAKLLQIAKEIKLPQDALFHRYFLKFESYFPKEFRWDKEIDS